MKKRTMLALLMSAVMLVSCSKAEPEETEEETTTTTTVEETTEETTAAPTPTPMPTATPTPTPEPTPTAPPEPEPDDYDPDMDYYGMTMALVDTIEQEYPGANRYFSTCDYYSGVSLHVIHPDNSYSVYIISGGEYILLGEGHLDYLCLEDYPYDAEAFRQLPCIYDMTYYRDDQFFTGAPADGVYAGKILAINGERNSVLISCGKVIEFDEEYVLSLSEGDVVDIPGIGEATVTEVDDRHVSLDNGFLIRSGCVNTGNTEGWYLADSDLDFAYVNVTGIYELPISSSCTINEHSPLDQDNDTLAEYQDDIASSDAPLAAAYYGQHIHLMDEYSNGGYYVCFMSTGDVTGYEVRGGEIVNIDIEYTFGCGSAYDT